MKNLKMTIAAIALASVSFGSFAADLVNAQPADLQKAGVVTVSGASDLTSLENKLAAKADEAGAKSFQIISTTGDNKLHGTAIIYNQLLIQQLRKEAALAAFCIIAPPKICCNLWCPATTKSDRYHDAIAFPQISRTG